MKRTTHIKGKKRKLRNSYEINDFFFFTNMKKKTNKSVFFTLMILTELTEPWLHDNKIKLASTTT